MATAVAVKEISHMNLYVIIIRILYAYEILQFGTRLAGRNNKDKFFLLLPENSRSYLFLMSNIGYKET